MKRIIFFIIIFVSLLISNNFVHSIYNLWRKQDYIVSAQKELDLEKATNRQLKAQLPYVKSNQFVEEEARDKLLLVKPGESDVLVEQNVSGNTYQKSAEDTSSNWQKWLKLFF